MSNLVSADDFFSFASQSLPVRRVPVPEWGRDAFVRRLNGAERDRIESEFAKRPINQKIWFLIETLSDEQGNRLFKREDAERLNGLDGNVLIRLFLAAREHNNITDEDVEELKKNSNEIHSDDSTSA